MASILVPEHDVLMLVESICFQVFPADLYHQLIAYVLIFRQVDRCVIEVLFKVWTLHPHHGNLLHNISLGSINKGVIEDFSFALRNFLLIVAQGTAKTFAFNLAAGHWSIVLGFS